MASTEQDDEVTECNLALSRRSVLKFVAGAPLIFTFGLVASPLARFFKLTMKPGGFFQAPDMPAAERNIELRLSDFPTDGTCIPFEYRIKYLVFNRAMTVKKPVLICSTCYSVFDIANEGRILFGPAPRPPRRFNVSRQGEFISTNQLENSSIS